MARVDVEKTVRELLELEGLLGTLGDVRQAKLAYMLAKNRAAIKEPLAAFREAMQPTAAALEFEKAREKLLREHARKDPKGNPIKIPAEQVPGAWQFVLENEAKYADAFEALRAEHAEAVKDIEEIDERRKQLLDEPEKITLHTIRYADLKEDEAGNLPIAAAALGGLISADLITEA